MGTAAHEKIWKSNPMRQSISLTNGAVENVHHVRIACIAKKGNNAQITFLFGSIGSDIWSLPRICDFWHVLRILYTKYQKVWVYPNFG